MGPDPEHHFLNMVEKLLEKEVFFGHVKNYDSVGLLRSKSGLTTRSVITYI